MIENGSGRKPLPFITIGGNDLDYKRRYQTQKNKYERLREKYNNALAEKKLFETQYSDSLKEIDSLNEEISNLKVELSKAILDATTQSEKCAVLNKKMGKLFKEIEREFYRRYQTVAE